MPQMTSRVELHPLTLADQAEFCSLVRASAELHTPWMQLPGTEEQFRSWMERFGDGTNEGLLIRVRETGEAAGMVNINSIIRGRYQGASLGYAAFAPSAGRGYMAEGLTATLEYAFDDLRLHRLEANIQPANKASLAVVRRLGFRYEGLSPSYLYIDGAWRDHERWSITAPSPWKPDPSLPEV
ncbi:MULTISPECIES: GNAT family N-acetyltransferase [unclassified Streptomyces]|uniref:GNAT family N-acetyltransferase n=1 Tax=unclassified Streptomyces TaxID=2593676 RepID=UPI002554B5D9|nr:MULTISPECIES: GNAT family N-acetyltransferase [unclassified Streptomyces]WRZ69464.1 GNAT family N-acetyltransferase [Streptomyces sp. NBC_01257]WSU63398.1 GNAT family N-acetyltransferase [Streptomyces sp. NBC_01104]